MPSVQESSPALPKDNEKLRSIWEQAFQKLGSLSIKEALGYPAAVAMVGVAAVASVLTQEAQALKPANKSAESMAYVGFNSNEIWVEDEAKAQAEAQSLAKAGANSVRIEIPVGVGGLFVKPVENRICSAARAARDNGLELFIYLTGRYRDGRLGYLPIRAKEKRDYLASMTNLMWALAGDKNQDGSGGCAPEVKRINISPINEPNNPTFNDNPDPEKYAQLLLYLYPNLHQEAAKPRLNVDLNVIGLDIATTPRSQPISFINALGRYLKQKSPGKLPMDSLATHYYLGGNDGTSQSYLDSAQAQNLKIIETVRQNFGDLLPYYITELGAVTKEADHLYNVRPAASVLTVSAHEQGRFYSRFIKESACLGVDSVMIFYNQDNRDDPLRSGVKLPNGQDKLSAPMVTNAYQRAKDGFSNC